MSVTLWMALLSSLNGIGFTFFRFKALDSINLSLYSLFSMLGGMILPFFQGILFCGEKISVAKTVCVAFVCAALALTVSKDQILLVIALFHLDASLQYPMVTGGVIIVSTLVCFFGKSRPSKNVLLSVLMAFIGMLALFLIKI